ncbi:MAG: WD40 repeat domain-containing protein [Anaerolineaceae bacterium]|nr:WD40 repeat domain-containing protein [Anaerolineaceae bacterium]
MARLAISSLILLVIVVPVLAQSAVPDYPVQQLALSGDGTRFGALGYTTNTSNERAYFVDILDASTLEILFRVEIGTHQPTQFDLSPDASWLVYNVPYTEVRAVNTLTGESKLLFPGGVIEVEELEWNPVDGRVAYIVGADVSVVDVYGNYDGVAVSDAESPGLVYQVAWSADGQKLATGTYAFGSDVAYIQIWSQDQLTSGGGIIKAADTRFSGGGDLLWNPAGSLLAARQLSSLAIYDTFTETQQTFLTLPGEVDPVSITWSPDGTQIATGYVDVIWMWDVATGSLVDTIPTTGIVDSLFWTDLGLIHNGRGNGMYLNGELVKEPVSEISTEVTVTPSATP